MFQSEKSPSPKTKLCDHQLLVLYYQTIAAKYFDIVGWPTTLGEHTYNINHIGKVTVTRLEDSHMAMRFHELDGLVPNF